MEPLPPGAVDPARLRPAKPLLRPPASWRDLRVYVYELPSWLNLEFEMDMYAGHDHFDSIYSAYNIFFERLLADKCAAPRPPPDPQTDCHARPRWRERPLSACNLSPLHWPRRAAAGRARRTRSRRTCSTYLT